MESDVPDEEEKVPKGLNISRDSEQREIDEFEEEERRLLAEEEKVSVNKQKIQGVLDKIYQRLSFNWIRVAIKE